MCEHSDHTVISATLEVIDAIRGRGYRCDLEGTGGNCTALVVTLDGAEILITDGDASAPSDIYRACVVTLHIGGVSEAAEQVTCGLRVVPSVVATLAEGYDPARR